MTDVVIVGGGAAGISAARVLAAHGVETLVIEAGPRLGGRASTHVVDGMALDLGCGWMHSADRNPLASIAAERGVAIDRRQPAWGTQYRDLGFTPVEQQQAREAMRAWFTRLAKAPPASDSAGDALPADTTWHPYIRAMAGFISGVDPARLSATDLNNYDQASTGCNWRVPVGYGTLIASSLPSGVLYRCDTRVEGLALSGSGVRLETSAGPLEARAAILTVSTAVLAGDTIRMPSMLDPWRDAAHRLPLGRNEKLFLGIAAGASFKDETLLLGNPHDAATGVYYIRPFGWPVIECFLGARSADRVAQEGAAAAFMVAIDELTALMGSAVRPMLHPIAASDWTRTPRIGGGYSCALPGASAQRQLLALPFEDRIFFAGEATSTTDFSTAHGAFASGVRAANEALSALQSHIS